MGTFEVPFHQKNLDWVQAKIHFTQSAQRLILKGRRINDISFIPGRLHYCWQWTVDCGLFIVDFRFTILDWEAQGNVFGYFVSVWMQVHARHAKMNSQKIFKSSFSPRGSEAQRKCNCFGMVTMQDPLCSLCALYNSVVQYSSTHYPSLLPLVFITIGCIFITECGRYS